MIFEGVDDHRKVCMVIRGLFMYVLLVMQRRLFCWIWDTCHMLVSCNESLFVL